MAETTPENVLSAFDILLEEIGAEIELASPPLPRGLRTPELAYYLPILRVLCEMGGSARVQDVLERVGGSFTF